MFPNYSVTDGGEKKNPGYYTPTLPVIISNPMASTLPLPIPRMRLFSEEV